MDGVPVPEFKKPKLNMHLLKYCYFILGKPVFVSPSLLPVRSTKGWNCSGKGMACKMGKKMYKISGNKRPHIRFSKSKH